MCALVSFFFSFVAGRNKHIGEGLPHFKEDAATFSPSQSSTYCNLMLWLRVITLIVLVVTFCFAWSLTLYCAYVVSPAF